MELTDDIILELAEQIRDPIRRCQGSVFGVHKDHRRKPDYLGCGTYFMEGDDVFMLTAMHVGEASNRHYHVMHCRGDKSSFPFRGVWLGDRVPETDIAIFGCFREAIDGGIVEPLNEDGFAESSLHATGEVFFCDGTPGQEHSWIAAMNAFQAVVNPVIMRPIPLGEPFDPEIHQGFMYPRDVDPRGMSGAAIWNMNTQSVSCREEWAPSHAKLVGVVQRWIPEAKCIVATRVESIRSFVPAGAEALRDMWRADPNSDYEET